MRARSPIAGSPLSIAGETEIAPRGCVFSVTSPDGPPFGVESDDGLTKVFALPISIVAGLAKRHERSGPELVFIALVTTFAVMNDSSWFNDFRLKAIFA
ncbi:hypothetical protein [Brucella intermedia]|uniref:hypothetical protein n=1 Tax=Brucella intermedia TaxID=94625 RepID=UPI002B061FDE|nr:hypothetical protein [Brucella intermedia]